MIDNSRSCLYIYILLHIKLIYFYTFDTGNEQGGVIQTHLLTVS